MGLVRKFFEAIPWYNLIPDIEQKIITEGTGTYGKTDFATAAFLSDHSKLVVYLPPSGKEKRNLTIDVSAVKGKTEARWYNPVSGIYSPAQFKTNKKMLNVTSPGDNGEGSNDWLLLIEGR